MLHIHVVRAAGSLRRSVQVALPAVLALSLAACNGPPEEALVGHWTFDESDGNTVVDVSGNGNNGQLRNGGRGEGVLGGALQMDGGNDSIVVIPMSDSLRSTGRAIAIAGWTYRTAEHNVDLLGHGYPSVFLGFHGPRFKWQVELESGKMAPCYASFEQRAELDRWYHLAGTWNGWVARLYVDGEQICRNWVPFGGAVSMPEVPFTISGYLDDDGAIVDEITGRIDDVRLYNRALSAGEIRALYNSTR